MCVNVEPDWFRRQGNWLFGRDDVIDECSLGIIHRVNDRYEWETTSPTKPMITFHGVSKRLSVAKSVVEAISWTSEAEISNANSI